VLLPSPITWVKKILAILKSELSPNQIAFAFALGSFAGLPPLGIHLFIPFTLALLVRCSFRSFLISMGLFKLLSLALAPVSYQIGRWLLDTSRGLDSFWRWLTHLPVLAPMGYERYLLLGSLVLAWSLFVPLFLLIRLLVLRYRESFAQWVSSWGISKRLREKGWVRVVRRFVAGGEAKYLGPGSRKGLFRFIRREMLVGTPVLYAICYLLAALIVPFFAADTTTAAASWVSGTEVAIEDASFNLFSGTLGVKSLSIQDPNKQDENLIEIPEVSLNLGLLPLLSGRVVFDRVAIADISLHVKREPDGTLNVDNVTTGWDASGYVEWAARYADRVDWLGLLRNLLRYLSEWHPPPRREDPTAQFAGQRSFPDIEPPFAIRSIEIGRVLISLEDSRTTSSSGLLPPLTLLEVEISNYAYPGTLNPSPMALALRGRFGDDPTSGFQLSATFQRKMEQLIATYAVEATRIDLVPIAALYETTLPVRIESGLATLTGQIGVQGDAVDGEVSILLEELQLEGHAQRPLFNLSVAASDQVIEGINRYARTAPIVFNANVGGTSHAPSLAWEAALLEIAREGLLMLGRSELDGIISQLGDRVGELGLDVSGLDPRFAEIEQHAQSAAQSAMEDASSGILEELATSLLGTDKAVQTESSPSAAPSILDRLFQTLERKDETDTNSP